jgi:hypothetical protein
VEGIRARQLEDSVQSAHDARELLHPSNGEKRSSDVWRRSWPRVVLEREPFVLLAKSNFETDRVSQDD